MTASSSPVVAAMARKRGSGYRWTPAEDRTLRTMREAGASWAEIAAAIPTRTAHACQTRGNSRGIRPPRPPAPVIVVEPAPVAATEPQYVVMVRYGGWALSVARGSRAEIDQPGRVWMRSHPGQVTIEEVTA